MLLAALAALAQAGPLLDLRVGESEGVARVVLVCEARCSASPTDGGPGAYRIEGLSDELTVETGGKLVRSLTITPDGGASILTVETARKPRRVATSRCEPDALCLDLDLTDAAPPPPPPSLGTISRGVDALEARGAPKADLRTALEAASGEGLGPDQCQRAEAAMMADAWNLGAFRTHALCVAARGQVGEADGYLARLEAYAPDEETAALRALLRARAGATGRP